MRILFFINSLFLGGKERRLTELMKALILLPEIEFELVLMNNEIHYKEVFKLGIKIHHITRKTKKDPTVLIKLSELCKQFKPDIVHCWDSMTAIYSVPICLIHRIKLVNGMVVDTPVKKNIFNKHWLRARLTFPFSNVIVGNSNAGLIAYKAPRRKSLCIYNGMDLKRFEKIKEANLIKEELIGKDANPKIVIGMVASFSKHKDYNTLINAAITLTSANNEILFILVGDGDTFDDMKLKVPVPLLDRILLIGNRNDVESIVNIFDIAILLTNSKNHGEGISNSIIEYMALSKPVIATRGGGTDELIVNGQNGLLINYGDSIMLMKFIEDLIQNSAMRENLGANGRQTIINKFDIRIMTDKYISLYNSLLSKNK
jgi:glycosyltransferase involved in cell wall biosynthesis